MALAQFPIDLYLWGGRERLQPAGQAGRPPLALTRGCFPFFFLVLLPLPCVLYVVCLCGRKHKQSKRWGSEARGAAGRKGRQPTTASLQLQLQLLVYIWCYPRSVAHCNLQTTRTTFCQTRERQIKGQVQTTVRKESSSLVFVCLTMTSECESTIFYLLRLYVLLLEYTH